MNIEELQVNTEILKQANAVLDDIGEVTKVVLMYQQGAPADSCMERIKKIITKKD